MILSIMVLSLSTYAQLRVKTDGEVIIGTESLLPEPGKLDITGNNETIDARIFATSDDFAIIWTMNSVYGYAFGIDNNGNGHIFKNFNTPNAIMTFNSNGNFGIGRSPSYKLDVDGNIRVNTTIYTSDERSKENITDLTFDSNILYNLRGVQYFLKNQNSGSTLHATETLNPNKKVGDPIIEENRKHFGFIAQEVQNVLPELVYEDKEGYLGIDYISFIPILLEELKRHKSYIENIELELKNLKQTERSLSSIQYDDTFAKLFQNYPNPYTSITTIKVYLSSTISNAYIYIYDMQGTQIKSYKISNRENTEIEIIGSDLQPGMYMYSLIADGNIFDTKTMILTD